MQQHGLVRCAYAALRACAAEFGDQRWGIPDSGTLGCDN